MSELLLSLVTGGATGLLGTVLSGVMSIFKKGQDNKQAIKMREFDLKELELEAANAEKMAAMSLEKAGLEGSYKDAQTFITKGMDLTKGQQWIAVFIDLVRGLMRPFITLFFLGITTNIVYINGVYTTVEDVIFYLKLLQNILKQSDLCIHRIKHIALFVMRTGKKLNLIKNSLLFTSSVFAVLIKPEYRPDGRS